MLKQQLIDNLTNTKAALTTLEERLRAIPDADAEYLSYFLKKEDAKQAVLAMRALQEQLPAFRVRAAKTADAAE